MQILRTVKIKIDGVTFCLLRPTALESVEISSNIAQLHAGEDESRFRELAELYNSILKKYIREIRDIEIENDEGEIETTLVKSQELMNHVIDHISIVNLSKLIAEYLGSLNPSDSEKKS